MYIFIREKYRIGFLALSFLSVMFFAAGASAEGEGRVTLKDALRTAYLNNPTLQAARTELLGTHELLPQAHAGWKPALAANSDITVSENDGSNFGTATGSTSKTLEFTLDQPLYRGGRTVAQSTGAEYQIEAQKALVTSAEQDVLLDAATAYMDVLRDQGLVTLSENNYDVISRQLDATRERFEVGELTRTDVSQAEARLADAESQVISANSDLRSSLAVFHRVIGLKATHLVQPDILFDYSDKLQDVIDVAQQNSPDVKAAIYFHKASEEGIDDVFGELLPVLGLFASWNRTRDPQPGLIDEQTTKTIGLAASMPLYAAGSIRSRVRQAKHEANQSYLQILEARRLAEEETISNWETWHAAQAEIVSRQAQVAAAKVAREGVHIEAELGTRTILDSLDADQELLDAEISLITARRNEIVSIFALSATLGLLTPEMLGFSEDLVELDDNLESVKHKIFDMDVDRLTNLD